MLSAIALTTLLASFDIQFDCVASSTKGQVVAIGLGDAHVEVVDVSTAQVHARFETAGRVDELAWCGPRLVSVVVNGYDFSLAFDANEHSRTFELWDVEGKRRLASRMLGQADEWLPAIVSPDGSRLLVPSSDGGSHLVSGEDLHDIAVIPGEFHCACFTPDGTHALLGAEGGKVVVLDASTGKLERELDTAMRAVRCIAVDPMGKSLVAGGFDQIARVYDTGTWKRTATWNSKTTFPFEWNGFDRIVFSPSGDIAYLSTRDWWSIQAWSLPSNTCTWWLDFEHGNPLPVEMVLSFDGRRMAIAEDRSPLRILDTRDGKTIAEFGLEDLGSATKAITWTGDGMFLIARTKHSAGAVVFAASSLKPLYRLIATAEGVRRADFESVR